MSEIQPIKASECRFAATIEVTPQKEGAKSAPIKVVARSGDAIEHHAWGRVVHDFDGMQHKDRIAFDYNHNPNDVVGYGNRFNTTSGDLEIKGALTPFNDNDRATEILSKSRADADDGGGVPYEASIYFAGPMKVEKLASGQSDTINGRKFDGPLTIIRQWHLRGVAITPYGYDHQTSTVTLTDSDRDISVELITKDTEMSQNTKHDDNTLTAEAAAVDADQVNDSPEAVADTATVVDGQLSSERSGAPSRTAQEYFDAFGEQQGSLYFAKGVPFDKAIVQENARLRDEVAALSERVDAQATSGNEDAVSFSNGAVPTDKRKDQDGKWTAFPVRFANDPKG